MTSSGLVSQLPTVENRTSQIGEKVTVGVGVDRVTGTSETGLPGSPGKASQPLEW